MGRDATPANPRRTANQHFPFAFRNQLGGLQPCSAPCPELLPNVGLREGASLACSCSGNARVPPQVPGYWLALCRARTSRRLSNHCDREPGTTSRRREEGEGTALHPTLREGVRRAQLVAGILASPRCLQPRNHLSCHRITER